MKTDRKAKVLPIFIAALVVLAAIAIHSVISGFGSSEASARSAGSQSEFIVHLDTEGFDSAIAEGLVLVDFWAAWCAPCRRQIPILEELAEDVHHLASITKLNVDDHSAIAARFGVRSIPTLILFKDGEQVERFMGVQQKETLRAAIENYL
ncbi:MAG: thioredoxin [Bacteroidia bacterium]|nr:MAG: thioredoxin [Bacteroidia bacterium]